MKAISASFVHSARRLHTQLSELPRPPLRPGRLRAGLRHAGSGVADAARFVVRHVRPARGEGPDAPIDAPRTLADVADLLLNLQDQAAIEAHLLQSPDGKMAQAGQRLSEIREAAESIRASLQEQGEHAPGVRHRLIGILEKAESIRFAVDSGTAPLDRRHERQIRTWLASLATARQLVHKDPRSVQFSRVDPPGTAASPARARSAQSRQTPNPAPRVVATWTDESSSESISDEGSDADSARRLDLTNLKSFIPQLSGVDLVRVESTVNRLVGEFNAFATVVRNCHTSPEIQGTCINKTLAAIDGIEELLRTLAETQEDHPRGNWGFVRWVACKLGDIAEERAHWEERSTALGKLH